MINELTQAQKDRFQEFADKWIAIGTCTEPANRKETEKYINIAYEKENLKHPKKIVWCDSPLSMALTHNAMKKKASVGDSVRDSVRDSVWASVGDSVGDSVRDSVGS